MVSTEALLRERDVLKRPLTWVDASFMGVSAPSPGGSRGTSTRDLARRRPTSRFPIGWKFLVLLAAVIPSMLGISLIAADTLSGLKARLDRVYEDNLESIQTVGRVSAAVREAELLAQRLVVETDPEVNGQLRGELRERLAPRVELLLFQLRSLARAEPDDLAIDRELERSWQTFLAYTSSQAFDPTDARPDRDVVSQQVVELGDAMETLVTRIDRNEDLQARQTRADAEQDYARSVGLFRAIVMLALLVSVGATIALIRNVVTRVREYSVFADRVSRGATRDRVRPRGRDELTDLGWALNEMVERDETARAYGESQGEFVEALQVTQDEEEAHELLKRHLERSVPDGRVVVLNRNNSADRLEATTELPADEAFAERIAEAKPRDCIAVRLARPHAERAGTDPLIPCGLCHPLDGSSSCRPLLVGGEVIGSVLLNRAEPFGDLDTDRVRDTVTQAAPVLANLRNLALAQLRAATDALTGLPNARAVQDTLNRFVAQASRMMWPLSAVLLDLDHFKQVNDTLGHGRGDEVLAAVGVALQSTIRDSDFVGRYGGEEFVVLLPNTDREGAANIADRVRRTIVEIDVLEDRRVTASLGVAQFPDDAPDPTRLIRCADRALYKAKANGRDRVEFFSLEDTIDRRANDDSAEVDAPTPDRLAPEPLADVPYRRKR